MKNETISIAIPTYEMGGVGASVLSKALDSIKYQTYGQIEVVISDHSTNDEIEKLCKTFANNGMNIIYVKNEDKRGNFSANLNNTIRHCTGKAIKFLMQDDFLCDITCIEKIAKSFSENNIYWLVTGCKFGRDPNDIQRIHSMMPGFSFSLAQSVNTIGSPSVLAIKNENIELFNEDLQWVVDLDYYLRMQRKFSTPFIINEHLVFILQHENQISETMPQPLKDKEQEWLAETYKTENVN